MEQQDGTLQSQPQHPTTVLPQMKAGLPWQCEVTSDPASMDSDILRAAQF